MSILLIDPPEELGAAVVRRLIEDGDEVRVLARDRERTDYWRALRAHVAIGDPTDDDLVERAALNVRTIVLLEWEKGTANVSDIIAAARRSGVDRVVMTVRKPDARTSANLERSDIDHVMLVVPRKLLGPAIDQDSVARAVSASDDLADHPRLTVDLAHPNGWEMLRLTVREG